MTCGCRTCREGLARSLDSLERMATAGLDFDIRMELCAPIAQLLRLKTYAYAKAGGLPSDMSIHLLVEDWPLQFKAGLIRVLGVDITWFIRTKPGTARSGEQRYLGEQLTLVQVA